MFPPERIVCLTEETVETLYPHVFVDFIEPSGRLSQFVATPKT